jgi:DNA-binding MarR family transcriptional regulator
MAATLAPDTGTLASQLDRRISRVTQLLRAETYGSSSVATLLTLRRLEDQGPMRITELATAERVAQPTMTGLVGRLEHDGLVRRTPDPDDARAVRVVLTDPGRDRLAAARQARAAVLQARLDALEPAQRAALAAAVPALDALLSPDPPA